MPRHSKHAEAGATFTYAERRRVKYGGAGYMWMDIRQKGLWGTQSERLGADSMKPFDSCSLCLHDAEEPLVCPEGHLFCKKCVYEALLAQKVAKRKQQEAYEEQEVEAKQKADQQDLHEKIASLEKFDRMESSILPVFEKQKKAAAAQNDGPAGYVKLKQGDRDIFLVDREVVKEHFTKATADESKELVEARKAYTPSFWLPSMTPDAGVHKVAPPAKHTICPSAQHKLRLKQLRPLKWTPFIVDAKAAKGGAADDPTKDKGKYMCGGCRKTLTNSHKLYLLPKCGHVHCDKCIDTLVRKDRICVECNEPVREKDLIKLEAGATGYAGGGAKQVSLAINPAFEFA